MARVTSQRPFSRKITFLRFVDPNLYLFTVFSNQTRSALNCCEDLPNFQPVNSDLTPFREFWMMSAPKQSTLKLKSDICIFLVLIESHYILLIPNSFTRKVAYQVPTRVSHILIELNVICWHIY